MTGSYHVDNSSEDSDSDEGDISSSEDEVVAAGPRSEGDEEEEDFMIPETVTTRSGRVAGRLHWRYILFFFLVSDCGKGEGGGVEGRLWNISGENWGGGGGGGGGEGSWKKKLTVHGGQENISRYCLIFLQPPPPPQPTVNERSLKTTRRIFYMASFPQTPEDLISMWTLSRRK